MCLHDVTGLVWHDDMSMSCLHGRLSSSQGPCIMSHAADLCPCPLQDGGKAAQKLMQPSPQSVDELKKILADARKKGTAPAKGEPQSCSGQGVMQLSNVAAGGMMPERPVVLCSAVVGLCPA